jgi:hypothetical protein
MSEPIRKISAIIPFTDEMVLTATEDANVILLGGDLPRHDDEPVWDYQARVSDEVHRRLAEGIAAQTHEVLGD